jgi:hypothetical protein
VSLSTIVAFTAAAVALIGVGVNALIIRRGGREQWRREQEHPLVARLLKDSKDSCFNWEQARRADDRNHDPTTALNDLKLTAELLELLAGTLSAM